MYSTVSIWPSYKESPTGFSKNPLPHALQTPAPHKKKAFSYISPHNLCFLLLPPFSMLDSLKILQKVLESFLIFASKKMSSFGDSIKHWKNIFLVHRKFPLLIKAHLKTFCSPSFFNINFDHLWFISFVEIVNILWLLPVFAEELHPECLRGFSTRLCPITYYSLQKVLVEAFHHWCYARESSTHPASEFSWLSLNTEIKR